MPQRLTRAIHILAPSFLALLITSCAHQPPTTADRVVNEKRYVTASSLNLRECPSRQCRVVSSLPYGTTVQANLDSSGWSRVALIGTATTGWVASRYLSASPNSADRQPPPQPKEEFSGSPAPLPSMVQEEFAGPQQQNSTAGGAHPSEEFAQ